MPLSHLCVLIASRCPRCPSSLWFWHSIHTPHTCNFVDSPESAARVLPRFVLRDESEKVRGRGSTNVPVKCFKRTFSHEAEVLDAFFVMSRATTLLLKTQNPISGPARFECQFYPNCAGSTKIHSRFANAVGYNIVFPLRSNLGQASPAFSCTALSKNAAMRQLFGAVGCAFLNYLLTRLWRFYYASFMAFVTTTLLCRLVMSSTRTRCWSPQLETPTSFLVRERSATPGCWALVRPHLDFANRDNLEIIVDVGHFMQNLRSVYDDNASQRDIWCHFCKKNHIMSCDSL